MRLIGFAASVTGGPGGSKPIRVDTARSHHCGPKPPLLASRKVPPGTTPCLSPSVYLVSLLSQSKVHTHTAEADGRKNKRERAGVRSRAPSLPYVPPPPLSSSSGFTPCPRPQKQLPSLPISWSSAESPPYTVRGMTGNAHTYSKARVLIRLSFAGAG